MRMVSMLAVACVTAAVVPVNAYPTGEQLNVWRETTFTAPIPCSVVCPYWLNDLNTDADADGAEDVSFNSCDNPGGMGGSLGAAPGAHQPGVSYADHPAEPAPAGARLLIFEASPTLDWDLFICSEDDDDEVIICSCVPDCEVAGIPNPPVPLGCSETVVRGVHEGGSYVLRAYNWSDPLPLQARYCFSSEGTCEEAS